MRWNPETRRYVNDRGRTLSSREVRKEVERYVEEEERKAETEAHKLRIGLIAATAFFLYMETRIEAWHKVAGAIAYGGQTQMDQERWARIERIVESEKAYLAGFAGEVAAATELTEAVENRAGMYANAAYSTYENQVRERERDAGVILGRRVCEEDGESCDECIEAATEEYMPLDELSDIGSLQCLNNCRCSIEFSYEGVEPVQIDREVYAQSSIVQ